MRNKLTRFLAVLLVTILSIASIPTEKSLGATASKAVKGTSKITLSLTKVTIKVGGKKTIKATLNKKQTKSLKVTLKSSNNKVVKVAKSVTVKKGKKVASFKITGLKKGTATITASFKTSANKTKKATVKVTVKKAAEKKALESVELNNTTPGIGDILTASINPSNAGSVTYVWYSGDTADSITTTIEEETSKSLNVTNALAGKFIKVVAKDSNNNSAEAVTTMAVSVPLQSVSLDSTAPKVNDKLTVAITPSYADGVTYKWYSGDTNIGITTAIDGATGKTLDVTGNLTGKFIKVVATDSYNNSFEAATTVAVLDESSIYIPPNTVSLQKVSLNTSTPKVNDKLTATINPSNADGVTYAWYSGETANNISKVIDDTTGNTLVVSEDLAGKFIKVVATDRYNNSFTAITTTAVPVPLQAISLNFSSPKVNDKLTAMLNPETATGVNYEWFSGDTADNILTTILQTGNTLVVTEDLVDKFIKVRVTDSYNNSFETATTTAVTKAVQGESADIPVNEVVTLKTISLNNESPKVNDTLTATVSPETATGVTYAWFSGDTASNISTVIDDATGNTLDVTEGLAGKYIKVVATDFYTNSVAASTTTAVPVPLQTVSLSTLSPKVNDTLTATVSPETATGVTYVWYSGDTADSITDVISGATQNTLDVTEDLMDKFIKVEATDFYSNSFSASTTTAVPVPLQTVFLSTDAPTVNDTLIAAINPEGATEVTFVWYSGDTADSITDVISGATQKNLGVTGALIGKYIKVVATDLYSNSVEASTTTPVELTVSAGIKKVVIGDIVNIPNVDGKYVPLDLKDANDRPVNDMYIISHPELGIGLVLPEIESEIVKIGDNICVSIGRVYYEDLSAMVVMIDLHMDGSRVYKSYGQGLVFES